MGSQHPSPNAKTPSLQCDFKPQIWLWELGGLLQNRETRNPRKQLGRVLGRVLGKFGVLDGVLARVLRGGLSLERNEVQHPRRSACLKAQDLRTPRPATGVSRARNLGTLVGHSRAPKTLCGTLAWTPRFSGTLSATLPGTLRVQRARETPVAGRGGFKAQDVM